MKLLGNNKWTFFILALLGFCFFLACSKDSNKSDDDDEVTFDKVAMLTNIADQIIIPGYTTFQQKVNTFKAAADAFLITPNAANQGTLKDAYKEMHLQYQNIEVFNGFGPAYAANYEANINFFGNLNTSGSMNGFTVDITSIENNIASGNYNLSTYGTSSFYSQGFPAIKYLFFEPDALNKFTNSATNRKKYAGDIVNRIKTLTDKVVTDWPAHRTTFVSNTKSDVGSSIGGLVNQMAYEMDALKGPRIGWPFGKKADGQVFKDKVEGHYVGNSVALALANVKNLKRMYTAGGSGKGFSDYLVALGKGSLNNQVIAQFDATIAKVQAIPDPLSESLSTHGAQINAAYGEIQKLLTLLKTDVASALGVQISFVDNDGD